VSRVRIPPTLRPETGGEREVDAAGETVRELLDDLMSRFPSLEGKLEYANVYVDGEDVRTLDGDETAVHEDATIILLPAMAGGAPAPPGGDLSRPAEPASEVASRRSPQDASPAALGRTREYCPARRRLASFASDAPGTRGC